MTRATISASWIEVSQTYLCDDSPGWMNRYEACVLLNRCEVRQTTKGQYLQRTFAVKSIIADSKVELETKVGEFILRDDVRVLIQGLEPNDDSLPRQTKKVPDEMAAIYIPKDSIAHKRRRSDNEEISKDTLHHA